MDLIQALAGQLGIDAAQAKALAGSVLGGVQSAVADEDEQAAGELEAAIPELEEWKGAAAKELGDEEEPESGLGGLLGAAAGALGGGGAGGLLAAAAGAIGGETGKDVAAVVTILDKLGIDSAKASLVAPTVLSFVRERVPGEILEKILAAAPLLAMVDGGKEGGKSGGGLGGLLGGLLD
jgi:hypothetical protein